MGKRYKEIGCTQRGEAIYRDLETGMLLIEVDFRRLIVAAAEHLEGAKFEEGGEEGEPAAL